MNEKNEKKETESPLARFGSNDVATPKRDKPWDECGIEEKVERLRMMLMRTRESAQYAAKNASAANDLAERHQHNHATGEVLRPVQRHGGAMEGGSSYDPLR